MADRYEELAAQIAEGMGWEFRPSADVRRNLLGQIEAVERALGGQFPESFRAFLMYFNEQLPIGPELYLMHDGVSYSGLRYALPGEETADKDDVLWVSDLVEENRRLRDRPTWLTQTPAGDAWWAAQPKWPDHLIVFAHSGMDWGYYFDLMRRDKAGECPVVVLPSAPGHETIATSFLEFARRYRDPS
ncbi:MAG: SMI1/KNR4 family protein [Isosphaeraceae bacterium]|nr:SMI1/KNR4 family protein [Isosphaeraceae bacterium]